MRRIGVLMATADDREGQSRVTVLKQGLQELGWTDGRTIQIETRFGGADADRIRAHAAELVALTPDVLVGQATPGTQALRQATSSIPIVPAKVAARPGFADVPAVRDGFLREIKSPLILQAGPAALTDGLDAHAGIIEEWAATRPPHG